MEKTYFEKEELEELMRQARERIKKRELPEDMYIDIIKKLKNKEIPEFYPPDMEIASYKEDGQVELVRDKIIELQGFALVSEAWINPLAKWIGKRKCLEIMAGCGSISSSLKKHGVDIVATDNFSWGQDGHTAVYWNGREKNLWCDVENIDCIEAIEKYGKTTDIIIMSWPYMDDTAYRALLKMREINPETLMIMIGESEGGCTASRKFYEEFKKVNDPEFEEINRKFTRWHCIHDYLWLIK